VPGSAAKTFECLAFTEKLRERLPAHCVTSEIGSTRRHTSSVQSARSTGSSAGSSRTCMGSVTGRVLDLLLEGMQRSAGIVTGDTELVCQSIEQITITIRRVGWSLRGRVWRFCLLE